MIINGVQFNAELSEIIEELQHQLTVNGVQLLQKTRDIGDDIMVQCPYHSGGQEKRPSAGIRKRDGQFHCFACGEKHSLSEVISHCFGHYEDVFGSFGWKWLNKNFATIAVEERKDVEIDFMRSGVDIRHLVNKSNINRDSVSDMERLCGKEQSSRQYVSEKELDKYRYYHPYWKKRGITDEWLIELFDLGYDKSTKCITFPVRDIHGNCLFVARRSVITKFFNYPKGVEKPLYGLYELHHVMMSDTNPVWSYYQFYKGDAKEIIVCESMLDALTAWEYGKYAVALNGLGNELQFKQLRELPCRKLILATDNDEAGMKARKNIREQVTNKIITEYLFPEGKKDLNDLDFSEFEALEEIF